MAAVAQVRYGPAPEDLPVQQVPDGRGTFEPRH